MRYQQKSLFASDTGQLATKKEDQWFDRKSIHVSPSKLANLIIGFANADGGTIAVGIEDNGTITGVDNFPDQQNALRVVPLELTQPPVRVAIDLLDCTNSSGLPDHVLLIEVPPSSHVHRNNRHEVFKRHGDQNRRLSEEAVHELIFDKGERYYDDAPLPGVTLDLLDQELLARFARAVGTDRDILRALRVRSLITNQDTIVEFKVSTALLFGQNPEAFLPSAFMRILRYEGTEPLPGTRLNISFDRRISGAIPLQIQTAEAIMQALLREETTLDVATGRFVTVTDIPRFAWLEAIVNAVTHRSYSMQGDHIRISVFDDRVEVHNPGQLPGPVRLDNIRHTRFSRNPRIARALAELGIVQELNEGVPRMFDEMARAGLPEPQFSLTESGFKVVLRRFGEDEQARLLRITESVPEWMLQPLETLLQDRRITTGQVAQLGRVSEPTARRYLQRLESMGELRRIASGPRDPNAYWEFATPIRGHWRLQSLARVRTRRRN